MERCVCVCVCVCECACSVFLRVSGVDSGRRRSLSPFFLCFFSPSVGVSGRGQDAGRGGGWNEKGSRIAFVPCFSTLVPSGNDAIEGVDDFAAQEDGVGKRKREKVAR